MATRGIKHQISVCYVTPLSQLSFKLGRLGRKFLEIHHSHLSLTGGEKEVQPELRDTIISFVTLNKLFNFSKSQFSHL